MAEAEQATPLYAVWLTQKEAMRICMIADEQNILLGVVSKIKASAHTKGPNDKVKNYIKESEAANGSR